MAKNNAGGGGRAVGTPYGEFDTLQDAADYLGKSRGAIEYRIATQPEEYYYIDRIPHPPVEIIDLREYWKSKKRVTSNESS